MSSDPTNTWGPDNPHPLSTRRTELIWEGKYDAYGNRRAVSLPSFPLVMQRIETIDEPRDRAKSQPDFDSLWSQETAHRDDFRNRLIWGDNKLALAALLNEFRGKVNLVYIDPPFDVGTDFTLDIALGEDSAIHKEASILELVAYRDMWGRNADSYLHTIYERAVLLRDLLAQDGTLYVHVGWGVSHLVKLVLDDVFGADRFVNQIVWKRQTAHSDTKQGLSAHGQVARCDFPVHQRRDVHVEHAIRTLQQGIHRCVLQAR